MMNIEKYGQNIWKLNIVIFSDISCIAEIIDCNVK